MKWKVLKARTVAIDEGGLGVIIESMESQGWTLRFVDGGFMFFSRPTK
jgi:hypothetical protein